MRILTQILLLTFFTACKTDNKNNQEEIFKDVINEFYSSAAKEFKNLYDSNEVIVNPFNDHLDSIMVARVKRDSSLDLAPDELHLFNELEKILDEPLDVDFRAITKGKKFILNNESQTDYEKDNYVGSTFISKVAIDDKFENGVFYIDIQLGKTRGAGGFFVFVKKTDKRWSIYDIWKVWT
jgi:hypothetical protein